VKIPHISKTYTLNLASTEATLLEALQLLEAQRPDERAKYVRVAVWGFAKVRLRALRSVLAQLPLVHELLLPD
jgi:hypothetical protein